MGPLQRVSQSHGRPHAGASLCMCMQVVKKLTMKKAYEVTMETHKSGKATVTQAWKSKVRFFFVFCPYRQDLSCMRDVLMGKLRLLSRRDKRWAGHRSFFNSFVNSVYFFLFFRFLPCYSRQNFSLMGLLQICLERTRVRLVIVVVLSFFK